LADILIQTGHSPDARQLLEKAVALDPQDRQRQY